MARFSKAFYIVVGWLCVGLGMLGIAMPLLPTTPFLLVALWAFGKSSPELAARIRSHPKLGPPIRAWQDHGVIPTYAKILALIMMSSSLAYVWWWTDLPIWVVAPVGTSFAGVGLYIVSRPGTAP